MQPHQQLLRRAIPITTDPSMLGIEGVGLQVTVLSQHGTHSDGTQSAPVTATYVARLFPCKGQLKEHPEQIRTPAVAEVLPSRCVAHMTGAHHPGAGPHPRCSPSWCAAHIPESQVLLGTQYRGQRQDVSCTSELKRPLVYRLDWGFSALHSTVLHSKPSGTRGYRKGEAGVEMSECG